MTQMPEIGIFATAVTFAMLLGGIDLSVVGIGNLCGIISSILVLRLADSMGGTAAVLVSYVVVLIIGALCGVLNGAIVHYLGVPAMLATLGSMQIFQGIAIIITNGSAVTGMDSAYGVLGNARVLGIPLIMILFLIIILLMSVLLQKRKFGMDVYMLCLLYTSTSKQLFKEVYQYILDGDYSKERSFPVFSDGFREALLCEAIMKSQKERQWKEIQW